MKTQVNKSIVSEILGCALICMMLYGCSTANRIYTDTDIVYGKKRISLKYYVKDRDRRSPLYYFQQNIIKEINNDNEISYKAFDVLTLSASSFKLDEKVFLIIDNEAFSMNIEKMEFENVRSISEDTEDVSTSDSTSVSVVTGYSENNSKIVKFSYKIPDEVISKIKKSDQLLLRYYAGPNMITVKPKPLSFMKIQQLIDIE